MKQFLTVILILMSLMTYSQQIDECTYNSELGVIIIRNDSVITENIQYEIINYNVKYDEKLNIKIVEYFSYGNHQQLTVVYKNEVPRHLMLSYIGYQEETFKIVKQ